MGLFSFLADTLIGGICPWGPNGAFPIIKKHSEEEPSSEEDKKPNYELLRSITPIKLHDDEAREVWLGKAHESPTHELHTFGSTELWQIDLIGTYKKPEKKKDKVFYRFGMGIDGLTEGATNPLLFTPSIPEPEKEIDLFTFPLVSSAFVKHKKGNGIIQRELDIIYSLPTPEVRLYSRSDKKDEEESTPLYSKPSSYLEFVGTIVPPTLGLYQPPEDNRNLDQKIYDFTDPMARKCVSFVDLMAQQRHEALQDAIQDAPSGYQLWTPPTPPQDSSNWTCTPNMPKFNLEATRPMPNGCHPIPPSAFPSF